jgi:hypothetical protein
MSSENKNGDNLRDDVKKRLVRFIEKNGFAKVGKEAHDKRSALEPKKNHQWGYKDIVNYQKYSIILHQGLVLRDWAGLPPVEDSVSDPSAE